MSWAAELAQAAGQLDPRMVVGVILSLTFGATVQSAVGFGMGLVSVPSMLWFGVPLPHAVALLLGGAMTQCGYGLYLGREHLQWRHSLSMGATQCAGSIAGVACMGLLLTRDPADVKQIVGLLLLAVLVAQLVVRPTPREHVAAGWMVLSGGSSGFLGGLIGIGGPPLVLYAIAHDWERDRTRVFLWTQFFLVVPVLVAALCWRFGVELLASFGVGALLFPVLALGTRLGLRLTIRWSAARLRAVALSLLFLIAALNTAAPYL